MTRVRVSVAADVMLFALALAAFGAGALTGCTRGPKVRVKETPLGTSSGEILMGTRVFSPDGRRFAYAIKRGQKHVMVVDGKEAGEYDKILLMKDLGPQPSPGFYGYIGHDYEYNCWILWSPDSRRLAFVAYKADRWRVVVDGVEGAGYDSIGDLRFSGDGAHLAYVAAQSSRQRVIFDAVEGQQHDRILAWRFADDAGGVEYVARDGNRVVMVAKETTRRSWTLSDGWGMIVVSDNLLHMAHVVMRGGRQFVSVDGKDGKEYDKIEEGTLAFNRDGTRLAYSGISGEKAFLVVDGRETRECKSISEVAFGGDGRLAYVAAYDSQLPSAGRDATIVFKRTVYVVVLGDSESLRYDYVHKFGFTSDGRLECEASRDRKRVTLIDGKEVFVQDETDPLKWRPDMASDFCLVHHEGRVYLISAGGSEDVTVKDPYYAVLDAVCSADGRHYAYAAQRKDEWFVVWDGRELGPFGSVRAVRLTPDGKHLVFVAAPEATKWLFVDGKKVRECRAVPVDTSGSSLTSLTYVPGRVPTTIFMDGPNAFHVIDDGKEAYTLLDVEIGR